MMSLEREVKLSYTHEFETQGLLLFRNAIAAAQIARLQTEIKKIKAMVMAKISGMERPLKTYSDIAERQSGRLDYRCGFTAEIFAEIAAPIQQLVRELSPRIDCSHYWGVVTSLPGAGPTDLHRDIYPILNSVTGQNIGVHDLSLPPYYFTVLIPLVELTLENGPTQFVRQSNQQLTALEDKNKLLTPLLQPGDYVIFDGRTLHRGLPNTTTSERMLAYITFIADWYNDQTFVKNNYLFPNV
jgi:ectoine hydroxylase-related dioxygenase (phytanoyl-CoA dioxygenase family)